MDNKVNTDTPGKILQNLLLEKAVHNKLAYAFCGDSPFRSLPNASTPPSGLVRNPFESLVKKRLHQSVISPSLFRTAISNSKSDAKFKWTIEEISDLKPAHIEESMEQFKAIESDPETEVLAQAIIDKFFNEKHIVPSPFEQIRSVPLISESTSPIKQEEIEKIDEIVQTVLTLPPILPEHIEAILQPYFSYTASQQRESKDVKLYRRLFEFDEEHDSSASVLSSPAPSVNLSPIEFSPFKSTNDASCHRNFGSDADALPIADFNISPIASCSSEMPRSNFAQQLNSSVQMSIDRSHNWVPDTLDQIPMENNSLAFGKFWEMYLSTTDSVHSPIPEVLSNSTVNWDMEYRHISFTSPRSIEENDAEMDVSNSNTPKSKNSFVHRQRKKLSDSFRKSEEPDDWDYNKENIYDENKYENKVISCPTRDITDAGYHTGIGLTMYEESWSSSQIFASTPTNRNKK